MLFVRAMNTRHEFTGADVVVAYGAHADVQVEAAKDAWESDRLFIDRFIAALPAGGSVLDVGSGSGNQSRYFADHGLRISMTDGTAEMLSAARQQVPRARAKVGVLPNIPFENEQFDGVFSRHVLQHLPLPSFEASITNMAKVLRPGGCLALILAISASSTIQQEWWNISNDDHVQINHYPAILVQEALEESRLVVLEESVQPASDAGPSILRVIARMQ